MTKLAPRYTEWRFSSSCFGESLAPHEEHTWARGPFKVLQRWHNPRGTICLRFPVPLHSPHPVHEYPHIASPYQNSLVATLPRVFWSRRRRRGTGGLRSGWSRRRCRCSRFGRCGRLGELHPAKRTFLQSDATHALDGLAAARARGWPCSGCVSWSKTHGKYIPFILDFWMRCVRLSQPDAAHVLTVRRTISRAWSVSYAHTRGSASA